jgi:all-trans-retinol 13,14-reductase
MLPDQRKLVHLQNHAPLSAARCVGAIHPKAFFKLAPTGLYREGYLSRARQIPETTGFFCMYATNHGEKTYTTNNIFLLPELDFTKLQPDGEATPYYLNFSHDTPQTASVIAFVKPGRKLADRHHADYRALKKQEEGLHRQRLGALCPEVLRDLRFVASSTPGTQKKYVGYSGGYGLMHDAGHANILPVTKLPGVYLAGQSVVAPGLLGSIISAFLLDKIIEAEQS